MKEWPLTRRPREPRPPIAEEDLGAWMAGEDVWRTSEHALPGETGASAAESAVNRPQIDEVFSQNAVFGQQIDEVFRPRCADLRTRNRSSGARELHSKAHGPSSISAAPGSSASAVILEGLGFASAAPAEEGRARPKRSPASAAEPTVGPIAVWLSKALSLKAPRARSAAIAVFEFEGASARPWPRIGKQRAVAREILEGSLASGQTRKRVCSRRVENVGAGLALLAAAGLLETTGDLGGGCLTWHGRSLPPLATGPRRG